MFEVFEPRTLMAADLLVASQSPVNPPQVETALAPTTNPAARVVTPVYLRATPETHRSDLNLDGLINHRDAHSVISFLNARSAELRSTTGSQVTSGSEGESSAASESPTTGGAKFDVNADGEVGPLDLLWIVNQIKEYDPLTPCDCGVCSRPTLEGRCENASLAQAQAASLAPVITLAPEATFAQPDLLSLSAAPSLEDLLRNKRK